MSPQNDNDSGVRFWRGVLIGLAIEAIAILIIAALIRVASADELHVQAPPVRWASAPAPREMIVLPLSFNRVNIVCRMLGAAAVDPNGNDLVINGCSVWAVGGCLVILPKVEGHISQADQDHVRAHEVAHCNGWPASHPTN